VPDFIADEEFVLDTARFSVWLFAVEETFEALPASDRMSANANTITIVFIVLIFNCFTIQMYSGKNLTEVTDMLMPC
jgi:hypothetical protein